ncbi:TPA: hypothetical protein N0F65_010822 [Lagenidium giganteum]|uniref:Uncharacterized protein n=1 Tax=Lagenidium giganteum TaxID=4803 RepID=A0AAV2Z5X8_9STRA|nr:TPA: hypothetical protein N0F65_010822 [Lagenidium giganteum]
MDIVEMDNAFSFDGEYVEKAPTSDADVVAGPTMLGAFESIQAAHKSAEEQANVNYKYKSNSYSENFRRYEYVCATHEVCDVLHRITYLLSDPSAKNFTAETYGMHNESSGPKRQTHGISLVIKDEVDRLLMHSGLGRCQSLATVSQLKNRKRQIKRRITSQNIYVFADLGEWAAEKMCQTNEQIFGLVGCYHSFTDTKTFAQ